MSSHLNIHWCLGNLGEYWWNLYYIDNDHWDKFLPFDNHCWHYILVYKICQCKSLPEDNFCQCDIILGTCHQHIVLLVHNLRVVCIPTCNMSSDIYVLLGNFFQNKVREYEHILELQLVHLKTKNNCNQKPKKKNYQIETKSLSYKKISDWAIFFRWYSEKYSKLGGIGKHS